MKSQLNIPEKIKVGFQKRSGTYTNKLAYIIYYDSKGKLRKEHSWRSWCHIPGQKHGWSNEVVKNDSEVDLTPLELDNVPTEGFVMNKKAGGTSWGWNTRQTKCRVFDPRGFEFEISIENLLYILQETNSIKGKGLEGEFVYSWEGKDIVLLPVGSQEYKESSEFTSLKTLKITKSDMVEGCSYLTKDQKEVIYLGRYPWYELIHRPSDYSEQILDGSKKHIFVYVNKADEDGDKHDKYHLTKGFTGLAKKTSDTPVSNFSTIFDQFAKSRFSAKPKGFVMKKIKIKFPEIDLNNDSWRCEDTPKGNFYLKGSNNRYMKFNISVVKESTRDWRSRSTTDDGDKYRFLGYQLLRQDYITFDEKTGIVIKRDTERGYEPSGYGWSNNNNTSNNTVFYTKEELIDKGLQDLLVELDGGNKVALNKY